MVSTLPRQPVATSHRLPRLAGCAVVTLLAGLAAPADAQPAGGRNEWPPGVFDDLGPVSPTIVVGAGGPDMPGAIAIQDKLMRARLMSGEVSHGVRTWLAGLEAQQLGDLVEALPRPRADHRASDAVIAVLIERHGVTAKQAGSLTNRGILRLADYFRDRGDACCVSLYQRLLAARREKATGWVPELFGLAFFYRDTQQFAKAYDLFIKVGEFTTDEGVIADGMTEAARCQVWMGNVEQARPVLQGILMRGANDWVDFAARMQLAHIAASEGKWEAAREVLASALQGSHGTRAQLEGICGYGAMLRVAGRYHDAALLYREAATVDVPDHEANRNRLVALRQRCAVSAEQCTQRARCRLSRVGGDGPLVFLGDNETEATQTIRVETRGGARPIVAKATPPVAVHIPPQIPADAAVGGHLWTVVVSLVSGELPVNWTGAIQLVCADAPAEELVLPIVLSARGRKETE